MASLFKPAPLPANSLGLHRVLGPNAAVKVSPICLGCMSFGDAWEQWLGKCDKKTTFEILDWFYENKGNFLDTANNYQNGENEHWIGEWMEKRKNRDQLVLATKYTSPYMIHHGFDDMIQSNFTGNSAKSLHVSVEKSLKALKTNYIDVLYLHWWDFNTSIEEVMHSLNDLVRQGKVLYLGVSDTPAWIVTKANQYARDHGLRPFVVYQGRWSARHRDFDRDILDMCRIEGMGIAPWGSIGGGTFKTAEQRKNAEAARSGGEADEPTLKVSETLEKVGKRVNASITSVAMAYVLHKSPYVFPILGGRKLEHLQENVKALDLKLSQEDIKDIEAATPFDYGFPQNMLGSGNGINHDKPGAGWFLRASGNYVFVKEKQPITPGAKPSD